MPTETAEQYVSKIESYLNSCPKKERRAYLKGLEHALALAELVSPAIARIAAFDELRGAVEVAIAQE